MPVRKQKAASIRSILTEIFLRFCQAEQHVPAHVVADKHGSLAWETIWHDDLIRSVAMGATELPQGETHVEFWAAADAGTRFTKRRTGAFKLYIQDEGEPLKVTHVSETGEKAHSYPERGESEPAQEFLWRYAWDGLHEAHHRSHAFTVADLEEVYPFPVS